MLITQSIPCIPIYGYCQNSGHFNSNFLQGRKGGLETQTISLKKSSRKRKIDGFGRFLINMWF
jgi:hypothetical protein